jgi:serine O-acetyltransferase
MKLIELIKIIYEDFSVCCKHKWYNPKMYLGILFSIRFHVLLLYRIGNYLYMSKSIFIFLNYIFRYLMQVLSGCHIEFSAKIGKRLLLTHPVGIVIGKGVVIGDDVLIYQNVTIGGRNNINPKYPVIDNNVILYSNSVVIGDVNIGRGAIIGALSLVVDDVPAGTKVYSKPACLVR